MFGVLYSFSEPEGDIVFIRHTLDIDLSNTFNSMFNNHTSTTTTRVNVIPLCSTTISSPNVSSNVTIPISSSINNLEIEHGLLDRFLELSETNHCGGGAGLIRREWLQWLRSTTLLCPLQVSETATIEDQDGAQVDFANAVIGGGVLGHVCETPLTMVMYVK